ncbi:hypothetical protein ANACAC_01342 [Anaerostipes caccae L1-92]|uniref:Uncharacterized protein n=1 Tax=Anaerostipes caccae (strain DSM 14662 / CCUG 47493 / JCM 13470 / NCIMB 13811 / L1-92) TaxID=411490 RepID=B0MCQ0_ANACD|nr:hypothetical protein ANACAC_01342 [Anaerostipes caccae L1-92]
MHYKDNRFIVHRGKSFSDYLRSEKLFIFVRFHEIYKKWNVL